MKPVCHQRGFTLIELVMVIIILGIVGSMVAVFMRAPIDAYFDTARRAALTDVADTALRRMARDIQRALPNSIRTNAAGTCIEFIPTRTGGRYRAQDIVAGDNSSLDFAVLDTRFNVLGTNAAQPANEQIQANDLIAVYNLGILGADAYAGNNTAAVTGVADVAGEAQITINARRFPFQSPNNRFHVIPNQETVVSYVCAGGTLFRDTNYGYAPAPACPAAAPALGARSIMANNANACTFIYNANVNQRIALVEMTLQLSNANNTEAVNLYHEVHVNNTP